MNLFELMGVQAPAMEEKKDVKKAAKAAGKTPKAGNKAAPVKEEYALPKTFNVLGVEEVELTPEMVGGAEQADEKEILKAVKEKFPWVVTDKSLFVEGDCVLVRPSAGMAKGELEQEAEKVFLGKDDLFTALPEKDGGYTTAEEVLEAVKKARPGYRTIITGLTEGVDGAVRIELNRQPTTIVTMPKESLKVLTLGGDCIVIPGEDCKKLCTVEEASVTEYSTLSGKKLAGRVPWKSGKGNLGFAKIGEDSYLAVTYGKKREVSTIKANAFDISGGAVIFDNGNEITVTPENFGGKAEITQDDVRDYLVNEAGRRHYNIMPIVVTRFEKDGQTYLHVGVKSSTKGAFDKHPFFMSVRMDR